MIYILLFFVLGLTLRKYTCINYETYIIAYVLFFALVNHVVEKTVDADFYVKKTRLV